MAKDIPALLDYSKLFEFLEPERKVLTKINAFSDKDDFIRSVDDAQVVLQYLEKMHLVLWTLFKDNSSLMGLFNKKYQSFAKFVSRERILELCFLDCYLFPEEEICQFLADDKIDADQLELYLNDFTLWAQKAQADHENSQNILSDKALTIDFKEKDLACGCDVCIADYRTRLRDQLFDDCMSILENSCKELEQIVEQGNIELISNTYFELQSQLDKTFYGMRYRLRRTSLNRLERQVKDKVKGTLYYPSELAKAHCLNLETFFKEYLRSEGLRRDLVEDARYEKFFRQMSSNIWRNERYLIREFKKLVKSVLFFKRKDISASILKNYLGEFWKYSNAREIKRRVIYHMGSTNSGKTYYAVEALCKAKKGCYLAPLRLLAGELYDTMNARGTKTTLLTGEEVIEVEGATHYSSTIEMARFQEVFDCCVIDEIQMISDPQRGWAWTRAFVNIYAEEIHICGDHTALDLVKTIIDLCGDTLEIKEYERMTKLVVDKGHILLGEMQRSDALIVFSRRQALKYKLDLEHQGFKVSIIYGRLGPEVRREQARKFDQGETDVIVSTDAIAMGMNLPIRRIIFSTLSKFINSKEYRISQSEIKQIAGRSGRYKRFPVGYVTCLAREKEGIREIKEALKVELVQKKECMVGPDLDIYNQVNNALVKNNLPILKLSEFLRLFNTMTFKKPFYCVELKDMIELSEMVEEADSKTNLTSAEIFGFTCAPVNLGLLEHVQYYVWILNKFAVGHLIKFEGVDYNSDDIDYLETAIKCVELFQWLSRHFNNKYFDYDEQDLFTNKAKAVAKLNELLSDKITPVCSSCGAKLPEKSKFAICENCFKDRRFTRRKKAEPRRGGSPSTNKQRKKSGKRSNKGKRYKAT